MKTKGILIFGLICGLTLFFSTIAGAENHLGSRLKEALTGDGGGSFKVWVYFIDKDKSSEAYHRAAESLTDRAALRRVDIPVDWFDLPVKAEYVGYIREIGGQRVRPSRWLNAVSTVLSAAQIDNLQQAGFVRKIELVAKAIREPEPESKTGIETISTIDSALYGISYTQIHQLNVDSLQKIKVFDGVDSVALDGQGVLVAFFDSGYLLDHPAFDVLNIIAVYDFLNDDSDVQDDISDGQATHGTATLSACGGYAEGELIGPAFGADYILAKTESIPLEFEAEEDNWVLASEWADSIGADIISSSLGYYQWYDYSDMNGDVAVTTIAADIAASRGILVVTAAGNQGSSTWHYIDAPSDADSVVTVGAVDADGEIAYFSSFGPTYDGRLKPEVVAMGVSVYCANGGTSYSIVPYTYKSGTSMSTPLMSGAAALLLQANPSLRGNPMELRQRIMESGDRVVAPDNHYGYGIPNFVLASGFGLRINPVPSITITAGDDTTVAITTLGPVGETVVFDDSELPDNLSFYDNGDGTADLEISGQVYQEGGRDYILRASTADYTDSIIVTVITDVAEQDFYYGPNPFSESLTFYFTGEPSGGYHLRIFNLAGERVFETTVTDDIFTWDGRNNAGQIVASGVYLIYLSADRIDEKLKIFKM